MHFFVKLHHTDNLLLSPYLALITTSIVTETEMFFLQFPFIVSTNPKIRSEELLN